MTKARSTLINLMRSARVAADLTQREAADRASVPRITLARFEAATGDVSAAQLTSLLFLYRAHGARIDIIAGTVQIKETNP